MLSAGIKELKAKLSSYVDRVRSGEQVIVTEHGEEVALIVPISAERRAAMSLVRDGKAQWHGGKPRGLKGLGIRGKALSQTILEERR
ncbi:MAG TPA: type II toxin-antitoxin system prevent-host-death family antitoxin [Dissulfurispiraceae bacterium]|jgi:prevent-host-death family protein|nr:type II toxin-antitoxin system prevent-host-death family antitoxin [Dissulfurispiraceae bacterium]